jgi:ankyrin repeat protein
MAALETGSEILDAMYRNRREEARQLAARARTLTVWEAAALGEDDRLAQLVAADPALVNAHAPDGHTPLGLAAFFGTADTVGVLLDQGADPGIAARNEMKVQPLHAAVAARNATAVALLLERGADPNARQQAGYTPLMGAAAAGRRDMADMLIARGADPALINEEGKSAADVAREHGHAELAGSLTARG